jgi:hypothetical protein
MGAMAAIVGGIGGLCAVLGILTITEAVPAMGDQFTWTFWFMLATILLLGAIALAVGRLAGRD